MQRVRQQSTPIPDDATDDSPVTCSGCGAELGRWGDLKAAASNAAAEKFKESIATTFGKAFEGVDGITFKKAN
jgi:hypothetical protein